MIIEIPDDNSIVKWKKNDKEDWKSAEISDLIKTYEERQRGEWIRTALYGQTCLECNQCGKADFDIKYDNFCPNCGADMRKGGAEE